MDQLKGDKETDSILRNFAFPAYLKEKEKEKNYISILDTLCLILSLIQVSNHCWEADQHLSLNIKFFP